MRTTLPDGTTEVEVIAKVMLPLPLSHAGELMTMICKAAERMGYTDVSFLTFEPYNGCIAGTPPPRT